MWEVKREGLVVSLSSMSEAQRAASWLELQREKKTTRKIPQSEYLLRAITSASQKQGCKLHKVSPEAPFRDKGLKSSLMTC